MGTRASGTFVISWSQCELDGASRAPLSAIRTGATWRWTGEAVRVDGRQDLLILDNAIGMEEMRARAARGAMRLIGPAVEAACGAEGGAAGAPGGAGAALEEAGRLYDAAFDVTDGLTLFTIAVIDLPEMAEPLLMFDAGVPPRGRDLWVVGQAAGRLRRDLPGDAPRGAICFTPGTRIATPGGETPVEALEEGDLVLTKDNGPQPLRWIGARRISGARLYAMPHLRPVRIHAAALGLDRPDGAILVSPLHRVMLRGPAARDLFGTPEVLACARDLVDGRGIVFDRGLREVTYIHLMLDAHQVLFANGVESESFHPAAADLHALPDEAQARLARSFPDIAERPDGYGPPARRVLSRAEAAILRHGG